MVISAYVILGLPLCLTWSLGAILKYLRRVNVIFFGKPVPVLFVYANVMAEMLVWRFWKNVLLVAFGQKTLQKKSSALDRINVRRLLIALKNFVGDTAKGLVFEQNTANTRNRFLNVVNPYLESVQQKQGLYAFRVVMDESNNSPDVIDRNQLVGQVLLQPTKTAEFVILDFTILPTGATFGE